ncbi:MAG TPA: GIY-YIG nuclease family protein [Candidatus Competibacter sp.]|nr:GIY-YIG nuclease family protein [Candidatus Competibacter sp.]
MNEAHEEIWWLYLMLCKTGRIYTGISKDPLMRFEVHRREPSAFSRMNKADRLLGAMQIGTYKEACRVERRVKRLNRSAKIELAARMSRGLAWRARTAAQG